MVAMPPETQAAWDRWADGRIRRELKAVIKGIGDTLREKFETITNETQAALNRRTEMIEAAEQQLSARIDALEKQIAALERKGKK